MESKNRNVWIIVVAVLVVACCGLACILAAGGWFAYQSFNFADLGPVTMGGTTRERIEQSFEVGDAPTLDIENFAGAVTVRSGPDGIIQVTATKKANSQSRLDRIQVNMSKQGDGVLIKSRMTPMGGNASVDLVITAPADSKLTVDTGAGAVIARDIAGPIGVNSGAGQVDLRGAQGPVQVSLGAGQIIYEGTPSGDCRFDTGAGEVSLRLPADLNMEVDLGTGMGAVSVDYDVDGLVRPREVRGIIGDGSQGSITAHTGVGAVTLRRK
ncbi:MAG TPA: hypothetical protein VLY63_29065 [Anaerolineae bacterium]|nr:hypothetical protein [Anaerolineae bacterium]